MLKVLIDATPIQPKPSGVGFYVANLIQALGSFDSQLLDLGVVYQPSLKHWLQRHWEFPSSINPSLNRFFMPLPVRMTDLLFTRTPYIFHQYFESRLNYPQIIHGTNFSVYPAQHSLNIMSLYDLAFLKYPEYSNRRMQSYTNRVKSCLPWTRAIMTISESSKRDIVEYLNIDPKQVYVTPLASRYSENNLNKLDSEVLKEKTQYDFTQPYVLFVSTIEPRKNIVNIIQAFNQLKSKAKIPHNLVLIGQKGWRYESIFAEIEASPWKEKIYHLDYLSNELVALYYSQADVFVYPSHYEGFGLPVLEAMTLGAPVVTANTSSLPEVAGDAALLVDPTSSEAIASAMLQIIDDRTLRETLIAKGRSRARLFSWQRTAMETLAIYQSLAG